MRGTQACVVEHREEVVEAAARPEPGERLGHAGETGARQHPAPRVGDVHRLRPRRLVALQVGCDERAASLGDEAEQRLGDRPAVDARRPLVAQELERGDEPRLDERVALGEEPSAGCVHACALAHRHHGLEHPQAGDVRSGHRDAVAREPQRGLEERLPGEPSVRAMERVEAGRDAGHGARRRADRVVHELLAERHAEVLHRSAGSRRDGDEAVEVPRLSGCGVEVNRVAPAEEAGHHGLRHARGEHRGDGGVGGRAARREDLGAGLCRRRVPRRDRRDDRHLASGTRGISRLPRRTKPSSGKSKRYPSSSPPTTSNVRGPIARALTRCCSPASVTSTTSPPCAGATTAEVWSIP